MLSEGTNTIMPVSPMYNGDGMNGIGCGGWWILLFWIAMMGGWGGNWGNNNNDILPVVNNTNAGFDKLALSNQIQSVQNSVDSQIQGIQNSIDAMGTRNQLSDIHGAITSGFAGMEIGASNRAMDQMQANFAMQQAFNDCCCKNQLASCQTQNLITSEAAATRASATQNTQAVLDKMCQMENDGLRAQLDAERRESNNLRLQLQMANLQASQTAQTAQLVADNAAQTQYIVNRVAPYPIPSYQVANPYGTASSCLNNFG